MKRFYSVIATAILALVTMTVSAQIKSVEKSVVGAAQVKGTLTRVGDVQKQTKSIDLTKVKMQRSTSKKTELPQTSGPKKAPAKVDVAGDTWTSLGTGKFTEDFMTAVFSSTDNYVFDVEIQESNEHPGVYRIVDPYKDYAAAWGTGRYDDSEPHYMYLHTEDGNEVVYMEHFNTGFYPNDNSGYGELYIMSYPQYFVEGGQASTYAEVAEHGWCGTINDGVITFPTETFFVQLLGYSTTNGWRGNPSGKAQIALPGVEVKDYSVTLAAETCNADNAVNFSLEAGVDVAALKFGIYSGQLSASDANLAYVGTNGNDIEAGEYSFTLTGAAAGRYTIIVAALDAAGDVVGGASTYCYIIDDDVENWTSLGEGTWGENIIAGYYSSVATEDIKAEIQEHNQISGLYRLVNPYTNWSYAAANEHETDHNHYIYIHAENPNQVWIEDTPTGLDLGDGMVSICSIADDDEDYAEYYTEYWGTFNNGMITFPAKALLVAEAHYKNGSWYQTNNEGAFYVALPNYVAPITDQIDFIARNYPVSTSSAHDGDITETTTYDSDNELFTATVTVSDKTTANRFWTANGGSQLRIYGGSITIDGKGKEIIKVELNGSQFTGSRAPSFTVNDLEAADFEANGITAESTKVTWVGSSDKFKIEHTATSGNFQINSIVVTFAPEIEPITLGELAALPATEEGVTVKVDLKDAKVTAAFDMDDYIVAFIEDEEAAIQIAAPEIEAGKSLTGIVTGTWGDYGNGCPVLMITENNAEAVDADVKTGREIVEEFELLMPENLNRLVTVVNSPMCPIMSDPEMPMAFIGESMMTYDVFYTLGDDYVYPENVKTITGILVPYADMTVLVPRSAEDIVAGEPTPLYLAVGEITKDEDWAEYLEADLAVAPQKNIDVEAYNDYVIVRAWAGTPGYDLKVAFNEEEDIVALTSIVDGVEGETYNAADGGYAYLKMNADEDFMACFIENYNFNSAASDAEEMEGYVFLTGYRGNTYGYYNLVWPQTTTETETTTYIVSWESDMEKANSVTTADGVKVQITGNESKQIQSGNAITLPDGTSYTAMKVSNGAQNTITLPAGMVATKVTFYSYVNKSSADMEGARTSYWKEVDGVTYTEEDASIMVCPSDKPVDNPDVATFAIDNKNSFTYTNAGEQVVYVAVIEAIETATSISNVTVNHVANDAIFNLAGQKVSESYKGIIIKNGKKMLNK